MLKKSSKQPHQFYHLSISHKNTQKIGQHAQAL